MRSLFRRKAFFTQPQTDKIVAAIKEAEKQTSGEVRLFVESRCRFVDPMDRAAEIFWSLKMDKTDQRNAVLVYIAIKDKQLAVMGDEGIHRKVGEEFWKQTVAKMLSHFKTESYVEGLVHAVNDIGEALQSHFPYDKNTDKNELPDDIVFGK